MLSIEKQAELFYYLFITMSIFIDNEGALYDYLSNETGVDFSNELEALQIFAAINQIDLSSYFTDYASPL